MKENMQREINTIRAHLRTITVTGEGSVPLAICIQAAERLAGCVAQLEETPKGEEEAKENG